MRGVYQAEPAVEPVFSLSRKQAVTAVGLGVAFWLAGVLAIRAGHQAGGDGMASRVILSVAVVPLTWLAIALLQRVTSALPSQVLALVSIATATAAFCDAAVLTWVPTLYAADPDAILSAASVLLWGIGWALALACWRGRHRR